MRILLVFIFFISIVSCSSVKVVFDQSVDFGKYKSFYCMECTDEYSKIAPAIDNEKYRELIRTAVIEELSNKGLLFTESNPDLLVDFKLVIEERMAILGDPETAYNYWETYKYPIANIKHRIMIINLVDANQQVAVWQGITSSMLESDPETVGKKTKKAIKKMFKQYKSIK